MKRFWIGFIADDPRPIGDIQSHSFFWTGTRADGKVTMCVAIEAENEQAAWDFIQHPEHYPEAESRFCEERPLNWSPSGDRFPNAQIYVVMPTEMSPKGDRGEKT